MEWKNIKATIIQIAYEVLRMRTIRQWLRSLQLWNDEIKEAFVCKDKAYRRYLQKKIQETNE